MRRRPPPELDWQRLKTHSLHDRPSKVQVSQLGQPLGPNARIADLLSTLPDQLAARSLRDWCAAVCDACQSGGAVVAALGGHVIKTGCSPYLIDWIRRGVLTGVCL